MKKNKPNVYPRVEFACRYTTVPGTLVISAWCFILFFLTGCATVFTGTTEALTFTSDLKNVKMFYNGRYVGELPQIMTLSRSMVFGQQNHFRFEKNGYRTVEFKADREFNTIAILNLSSVFSWATDILSGAVMEFNPNEYHIMMVPEGSAAPEPTYFLNHFVRFNFDVIQRDLARGHGPAKTSLAILMKQAFPSDFHRRLEDNAVHLVSAARPDEMLEMLCGNR